MWSYTLQQFSRLYLQNTKFFFFPTRHQKMHFFAFPAIFVLRDTNSTRRCLPSVSLCLTGVPSWISLHLSGPKCQRGPRCPHGTVRWHGLGVALPVTAHEHIVCFSFWLMEGTQKQLGPDEWGWKYTSGCKLREFVLSVDLLFVACI